MIRLISLLSFITLIMLNSAFATTHGQINRPIIIKTNKGTYIIPAQKKPTTELKGSGITFKGYVKTTEKKVDGKMVKSFSVWVRGCGQVELSIEEDSDNDLKNGTMVELRFDRIGSCKVIDWKKV